MGGGSSKKQQPTQVAAAKAGPPAQQTQPAAPANTKIKNSISPRKPGAKGANSVEFNPSKNSAELQEEAFLSSCAEELEISLPVIKALYESYCNLNKTIYNTSSKSGGKISLQLIMESKEFRDNPFALKILEFMSTGDDAEELNEGANEPEKAMPKKVVEKKIDFKTYAKFMSVFMGPEENLKAKLTTIFLLLCRFGSRHDCLTNEHLRNLSQIIDPSTAAQNVFRERGMWTCQRFIDETSAQFKDNQAVFTVHAAKERKKPKAIANTTRIAPAQKQPANVATSDSGAGVGSGH